MTLPPLIRKKENGKPANANPAKVANDGRATTPPLAELAALALAKSPEAKTADALPQVGTNDAYDLVREFMKIDCLSRQDAEALAAISVQPRPASKWLALIAELDSLIERYCTAYKASAASKATFMRTRRRQSLASIPVSLEWFRREVAAILPPTESTPKLVTGNREITSRVGIANEVKHD